MWPRISLEDFRIILHYLGVLVCMLAGVMVVPMAVGICLNERAIVVNYLLGAAIALMFGAILMCFKLRPAVLTRKQAITVTVLGWFVIGIFAAIPLYLSGHFSSTFDAYFEVISGLTTTGFSVAQDLDHLSYADNMWRFMMHFIGGQGVVVIAVSLGVFGKSGTSLYTAEGRSEHVLPNIKATTQFIGTVAAVVTTLGTLALMTICIMQGFDPVHAFFNGLWVTLGCYDTGGFSPHSTSIIYYQSWTFEVVAMLIMLLGSVNFVLYARVVRGNVREFFRNIEVRTLFIWLSILVVVFSASLFYNEHVEDIFMVMRRGVFLIISAATSTGYQLFSSNQMQQVVTSGATFVVILAMAIGASSGSTAGGIKAMRLGIMCKASVVQIRRVFLPDNAQVSTVYYHGEKRMLTSSETNGALVVLSLFCVSMVFGALLGIAYGYDALPAIFESVSAVGDSGLSSGIVSPTAPRLLMVNYLVQMLLGRLEFLSVLSVLVALIMSPFPQLRKRKAASREG